MIKRVGHVNLSVDDVERARAFYGELLGLSPAPRPADAGRAGCWFALGDVELHISLESGADNAASKRHIALEVDGLDAWRGRFVAAGIGIEEARPIPGMARFFVRDPAGNRVEIYEPRP